MEDDCIFLEITADAVMGEGTATFGAIVEGFIDVLEEFCADFVHNNSGIIPPGFKIEVVSQ